MTELRQLTLFPARPGTCPECAITHDAEMPHDRNGRCSRHLTSLYYRVKFQMEHGRPATWADAMAHCSPEIQDAWREETDDAHG